MSKRRFGIVVFVLIVSGAVTASLFLTLGKSYSFDMNSTSTKYNETITQRMQIIVVPYFDPTSSLWQIIYDEADKHPGTIKYAVINPCSGPCGPKLSKDWQDVISTLKSKGIKTLGYIFDNSESFSNIDYYMKDPPVTTDGIFFDNEGSTDNLANFKKYSDYVHDMKGIVYINPGFNYTYVRDYLKSGAVDVANIHELDSNNSHYIFINNDFSPWQISVIVGNVTDSAGMQSIMTEIAGKGIGISYICIDSYGNLPTFFSDEIQKAAATNIQITK